MEGNGIREAIAGHEARNALLRETLIQKQVDPKESRPIECHFWVGGKDDAMALADALRTRGFRILVERKAVTPDPILSWNVEAEVIQSVDVTITRELTDELVRLAAAHKGRYDGWGTRI